MLVWGRGGEQFLNFSLCVNFISYLLISEIEELLENFTF